MDFTILILLLGILYGYSKREHFDSWSIFKKSLKIGVIISFSISLLLVIISSMLFRLPGAVLGGLLTFGLLLGLFILTISWSIAFSFGAIVGNKFKEFNLKPEYALLILLVAIFSAFFLITQNLFYTIIGTFVFGLWFYLIYTPSLPKIHLEYFENKKVVFGILAIFAIVLMAMWVGKIGLFASFVGEVSNYGQSCDEFCSGLGLQCNSVMDISPSGFPGTPCQGFASYSCSIKPTQTYGTLCCDCGQPIPPIQTTTTTFPTTTSPTTTTTTTLPPTSTCNKQCNAYNYDWGACVNQPIGEKHLLGDFCGGDLDCWCGNSVTSTTTTTTLPPACVSGEIRTCYTSNNKLGEQTCNPLERWGVCIEKTNYTPYILGGIILLLIIIIIVVKRK